MKNSEPLIEFNPKLPKLSKSEKAVLRLLIEAGKLIVPVYLEQEKLIREGISKKEFEEAAKKNPAVSSPYTALEKINGEVVAIPYHIKYEKLLRPIADKLNEASKLSEDKEFSKFLKLQAKALMDGSYDQATIANLKMKPYLLDISIGPVVHFDKELFFAKAAYQCWVGILDKEGTKRINRYKDITLSVRRRNIVESGKINTPNKIKAKTIDVLLVSGFLAKTRFVGINLPMNLRIVEQYGSEVTVFNQMNDARMEEQIIPTFKKRFSLSFREGFSFEDLRRGSLRYVALHEIAHNYLFYKNAFTNFHDLLPSIYELSATVLGMRIAGTMLVKDIITQKQLESMIVAFICRSFYLVEKSKKDKSIINYATGGAIFINFMLESGALRQLKGLAIPNFMKIFVSLHDLSHTLEHLLSTGNRKEAEAFIKKYGRISLT